MESISAMARQAFSAETCEIACGNSFPTPRGTPSSDSFFTQRAGASCGDLVLSSGPGYGLDPAGCKCGAETLCRGTAGRHLGHSRAGVIVCCCQKLSESTGMPYVLDFRDAWTITYNDFEDRRPNLGETMRRTPDVSIAEKAQSLVFRFSTEAECYWRAYKGAVGRFEGLYHS